MFLQIMGELFSDDERAASGLPRNGHCPANTALHRRSGLSPITKLAVDEGHAMFHTCIRNHNGLRSLKPPASTKPIIAGFHLKIVPARPVSMAPKTI